MLNVSVLQMRLVCAIAILAFFFSTVLPMLEVIRFDDQIAAARTLSTYDSILPSWGIWAWSIISGLGALAGLVGLAALWPPSRWLLAVYSVALVLSQPFMGLAVLSPYEATFGGLFGTCTLWLVTISFWSPFAGRFRATPHASA